MIRFAMIGMLLATALMAQPRCTLGQVSGTYVVYYTGWATMAQEGSPLPMALPATIAGVMSIGGDGKLSGTQTLNVMGQVVEYEVDSGAVELKPDCTGTMRTKFKVKGAGQAPGEVVERFAALPHLQKIITSLLTTNSPAGGVTNGIWERMSPVPNAAAW